MSVSNISSKPWRMDEPPEMGADIHLPGCKFARVEIIGGPRSAEYRDWFVIARILEPEDLDKPWVLIGPRGEIFEGRSWRSCDEVCDLAWYLTLARALDKTVRWLEPATATAARTAAHSAIAKSFRHQIGTAMERDGFADAGWISNWLDEVYAFRFGFSDKG